MIVNAQGKPYSKRDGDAYVGDFRTKGILPEALFNYLALLGWSPGDDREKMTISELTTAFTLDRVRSAASQMDMRKLTDLNGQYLAELPLAEFARLAREWVAAQPWAALVTDKTFCKVCGLMQIRTKTLADVAGWGFWFLDLPDYDEKACQKQFKDPAVRAALQELLSTFAGLADFTATNLEPAIQAVTATHSIAPGKLNQPLRVAVTGTTIGAGIFETVELLGRDATVKRLAHAVATQMAQ